MNEPIFAGIDLGTTFSALAIINDTGQPVAVPNAEGQLTTPSAIHVNPDGSFIVGAPALAYPNDTLRTFKRLMGSEQSFLVAGHHYTPVQLSAAVLRKLTDDASARLGRPIREVVISVPAYFGQIERDATRAAAELAGLAVLQMINEPTAAASVYATRQQLDEGHLLVFDLGGGTFDVTLLEVKPSGPYVRRTAGSVHLGGQDFTDGLVRMLEQRYQQTHQVAIDGEARAELGQRAEAAKIALSAAQSTTVTMAAAPGPQMEFTLTRDKFEESIGGYLMQIQTIIELLLDRVQLVPGDIKKVLLVGGSSRVPSVRALLRDMFGQAPDESLDPDLAVSWGAALTTMGFKRESGGIVTGGGGLRIADSVSHGVGVKALRAGTDHYIFDAILPAGYPLETWSNPRFYVPEQAKDTSLRIEVFQGDTADLSGCTRIGQVPIPLPADSQPESTQVRVWMKLDRSGLLQVQVSINGAEPHQAEFKL